MNYEFDYSLPSDEENSEAEGDDYQIPDEDDFVNYNNIHHINDEGFFSYNDDFDVSKDIEDDFRDYYGDPLETETNNLNWSNDTSWFEKLNLSFDEEPVTDHTEDEFNSFNKFFDDRMFNHIVQQTNLYAVQKDSKNWSPTSVDEIKAFFGMIIMMGIHVLPSIDHYWSSDPVLRVDFIANVMPVKRFKKILENIHFNDNSTQLPCSNPEYDKLHKLRPIIDMLNANIGNKSFYLPSSYVVVDESMIRFKGRSAIKQYMPMKPIKWGYKVWCIADSTSGFVFMFQLYTGKSDLTGDTLGEKVVLHLAVDVRPGSLVTFDNFFTSVTLMEALHQRKLYACGTVRSTRKHLPEFIKPITKKSKSKIPKPPKPTDLKRGEYQYQTKGPVAATKWMDSKPVCMLSTAHNPKECCCVQRRNKDGTKESVPCPKVVSVYNEKMGGVDRFDQFRERYEIGRRSVKWWHRIMYFLIDLAVVDGFILWKTPREKEKKLDQLTYRLRLARQLINGFSARKRRGRPVNYNKKKKGKETVPNEVRLVQVGKHMPKKNSTYRRCKLCSTKKQEKRTKITCTYCDVPLCLDPCFSSFHAIILASIAIFITMIMLCL